MISLVFKIRHRAAAPLVLALCLAACTSTRAAEDVLGESVGPGPPSPAENDAESDAGALEASEVPPSREQLAALAVERLEASANRSRAVLAAARADDAGPDALIEAARTLVLDADLRIQTELALRFDPADLPSTKKLINAEDSVRSSLKSEVRGLASASRDLANRALEVRKGDPEARLYATLGSALVAWSLPRLEALTSGGAGSLPGAIAALADDHPDLASASPMRLRGRFQSRAPWPYTDRKAGVEALEAACRSAPTPLNLLFLGDAYWLIDREPEALDAWERATRARAGEEMRAAAVFQREIARLRILSAGGD
ncbi:MAG: hypothetical protein AAGI22_20655 [Planctomycetota bacterium]